MEDLRFKKGDRVVRFGSNKVGRVMRVGKGRDACDDTEYVYVRFPGNWPEVGGWLPNNLKHKPNCTDDNLREVFG